MDNLKQKIDEYFNGNIAGQCYVVSEAVYHILGGKDAGLTPMVIDHNNGKHWYLRKIVKSGCREGVSYIDLTKEQFSNKVPYSYGRGCGFLTKQPSRRAKDLIKYIEDQNG